MDTDTLQKLKSLKKERGRGALFGSPEEALNWIDEVAPLLKFNDGFYQDFLHHSQFVQNITLSADTLMSHLNPMISIVNQAISELEKPNQEQKYVVDTCIINKLVDGLLDINDLPAGNYVATHIQIDELNKTKDEERRAQLFLKFSQMNHGIVPTETFVLDVSRLDNAKFGDGVLCNKLLGELNTMNNCKKSNISDVLIAEVAISNNWKLLTTDKDLALVSTNHECKVQYWSI